MNTVLINITSFMDIGSFNAEHYYAKVEEYQTDDSLAMVLAKSYEYDSLNYYKLNRKIGTKEAKYLNKKDDWNGWESGMETERFNSVDEVITEAKEQFPNCAIGFLRNRKPIAEHKHIYRTEEYRKSGKYLKIQNFEGFSKAFTNLTEGSEHEIIDTPERYRGKELQKGHWVMGVGEPVLVLSRECILL